MGAVNGYRKSRTTWDKVWQSIRILRRFTLPDLVRTSGAKLSNVRRFVWHLKTHGIIAEEGVYLTGYPGRYRRYRLVRETPKRPVTCTRCGGSVSGRHCMEEKS